VARKFQALSLRHEQPDVAMAGSEPRMRWHRKKVVVAFSLASGLVNARGLDCPI
jgi:hypothetical protein